MHNLYKSHWYPTWESACIAARHVGKVHGIYFTVFETGNFFQFDNRFDSAYLANKA